MRYYIADSHFYHGTLNTKMDCRGFADADEMNAYMLEKWNRKVHKNDEVVILGDLCWGNADMAEELIRKLNGKLYLVVGNHDQFARQNRLFMQRFKWVKPYAEMSDSGRKVVLCHYPIMCYNGQYKIDEKGKPKTYMLYGHVHDTMDQRLMEQFQAITRATSIVDAFGVERKIPCNMINCFCKYSDYEPLTLDEWIALTNKRMCDSQSDESSITAKDCSRAETHE